MMNPAGARLLRASCRVARRSPAILLLIVCGCTSLDQWAHNRFKVGPNFQEPTAAVSSAWLDQTDPRLSQKPADDADWWSVFHDPTLNALIETAYRQNLDLKTAATRVLQAQAQRNITAGNLFPQSQNAIADYTHAQIGKNFNLFDSPQAGLPNTFNVWATGFNASWELDLWGRLRRNIESANADRDVSVEAYRDVLVTLVADVATNYIQMRTFQQRIVFARRNVVIQRGSLSLAEARLKQGVGTALDIEQARSSLAQTESTIPPLAIGMRQANNRLCILLGQPVDNLAATWSESPIPTAPPEAAVGVPADLVRRRPDVRQALWQVASQCAQIGVAEADLYPRLGVSGFIGYAADDINHLFAENSFTAYILPSFQWKILNYGRIVNNVRVQDARLQQRALEYQQKVLTAGREVEDALVGFIQYQVQSRSLEECVTAAGRSVELVQAQYKEGHTDFNRVFTTQLQLVTQQDQLAAAQGNIALSLISVYRALGGGWQYFTGTGAPAACLVAPALPSGKASSAPASVNESK